MRSVWLLSFAMSFGLFANDDLVLSLLTRAKAQAEAREIKNFHGLQFSIDSKTTSCSPVNGTLECTIAFAASAKITFEKTTVPSSKAALLIPINRKYQWQKEHPNLGHYAEEPVKLGEFSARKQQARYFHLNNIQQNVLISALDVVTNERTVISVTTICGASDCSLVSETIRGIENSFKKVGKKSVK